MARKSHIRAETEKKKTNKMSRHWHARFSQIGNRIKKKIILDVHSTRATHKHFHFGMKFVSKSMPTTEQRSTMCSSMPRSIYIIHKTDWILQRIYKLLIRISMVNFSCPHVFIQRKANEKKKKQIYKFTVEKKCIEKHTSTCTQAGHSMSPHSQRLSNGKAKQACEKNKL